MARQKKVQPITESWEDSAEAKHLMAEVRAKKRERTEKNIDNMTPVIAVELDGKEARVSGFYKELRTLPIIDIDSVKQVRARIDRFWDMIDRYGVNPSFEALGCALCVSRITLLRICNGDRITTPEDVVDAVTRAASLVNAQANSNAEAGTSVPVMRIFNSKNNFGYRDTTEIVTQQNRIQEQSIDKLIEEARLLAEGAFSDDEQDQHEQDSDDNA